MARADALMRPIVVLCALAGAVVLASPRAEGHGLEPALLSLRELTPGRFAVVWKSSNLRLPGAQVRPILPDACRPTMESPQAFDDGDRLRLSWVVDCGPGGLAGETIRIADLDVATIDALLRFEPLGGATVQTVLTARQPGWMIPPDRDDARLVWRYAQLGAAQMLTHPERLLAVFGLLLLIAPAPRRLIQAAIALALGHGVGLVLAATAVVPAPQHALEIVSAVIVLGLAAAMIGGPDAGVRLRRFAPTAALVLGLLSGAAAGPLLAAGRASAEDGPLGLLAFNLGLEGIQLAALAAAATPGIIVARGLPRAHAVATRCAAYVMGILGVFWFLERLTT